MLAEKDAKSVYIRAPATVKDAWTKHATKPRKRPRFPVSMYSANGAPGTLEAFSLDKG